jgi:hypothetical protein
MSYLLKHQTQQRKLLSWEVTLLLAVFTILTLIYSLVLPLGEAADERHHFDLVRFMAEAGRPPLTIEERISIGQKGDASPLYHGLVALLTQHVDVSALPELPRIQEKSERLIPFDGLPFVWLLHTEDEAFPFQAIVLAWHLARLVSIPLGMATIIAVYLTVLAIYPQRRYLALAAAGFVAFLPRFMINSAIVSDDNLVVPLIAFTIYYLVRVAQRDERPRTFVILGGLMGLAAISKYHSLVLVPETVVIFIGLAWRNGWGWRRLFRYLGRTLLAFALVAGWWFAFLVIQFNQVAELGLIKGVMVTLGDPVITAGVGSFFDFQPGRGSGEAFTWLDWANLSFKTFWIAYGSLRVLATTVVYRLMAWVSLLALLGLSIQASLYLFKLRRQTDFRQAWRPDIAVLALHFLIYLGVVMIRYLSRNLPETAQGRHLYPAITSVAFFFVIGLSEIWRLVSVGAGRLKRRIRTGGSLPVRDAALAVSVSGALIGLSAITPSRFILPVYDPLPITRMNYDRAPIAHRLPKRFADGIRFEGFSLGRSKVEAGEALPISLYWQAETRQERDYLIQVCLRDERGRAITCHQGHPVDGRYPMRAWEVGYLIRDDIYLPTPPCSSPGDYELTLSVWPLRLDVPFTVVDRSAEMMETVSLGWVSVAAGQRKPTNDFDIWIRGERQDATMIVLSRIRQGMTVVRCWVEGVRPATDVDQVRLVSADPAFSTEVVWPAIPDFVIYQFPDGSMATTHNFIVDPGVRPGIYRLQIVEDPGSEAYRGERPENTPSISVITRQRNFDPPAGLADEVNASFDGSVELLDYQGDLSPRLPGDTMSFTLHWRTLRTMSHSYVGSFHLLDYTMTSYGQVDHILGGAYRNVLWAPGEIIDDVYHLTLSDHLPSGLYNIEFGVYDYISGDFNFLPITMSAELEPVEHLNLGQVRIMDPAQPRPPDHPLLVELGEQIQLLGYDLSAGRLTPAEPLQLTLHWQAVGRPATSYTVFTQLIGSDDQVWGQQDNQPQGGRYPTTVWTPRDRVADRYVLTLREGAPPGQYRLLVGMYDLSTGERLPAINADGTRLPGDAILLATLTFE